MRNFKIKNFGENESIEISLHESNSNGGYPRYLGSFLRELNHDKERT